MAEQDGVVGALYGRRKILEASLVAPPDPLRDIMAARENSISDSTRFLSRCRRARPRSCVVADAFVRLGSIRKLPRTNASGAT